MLTPVFAGPGVCSAAVLTDGQLFTWGRDAGGAGDSQGIPRPLSGLGEHVFVQARAPAADAPVRTAPQSLTRAPVCAALAAHAGLADAPALTCRSAAAFPASVSAAGAQTACPGAAPGAVCPGVDLCCAAFCAPRRRAAHARGQVACGEFHAAAVTSGGLLFTWGDGLAGKLGHGDEASCAAPRQARQAASRGRLVIACNAWQCAEPPACRAAGWSTGLVCTLTLAAAPGRTDAAAPRAAPPAAACARPCAAGRAAGVSPRAGGHRWWRWVGLGLGLGY
jgi:hypothetical protein